jgi:RHH-type transcriptional regulator, proline utilization regulon repressor / proline dehydrogenase / delta 1-pyrroline-5-carboxylate dehydrogenase
MQNDLKLIKIIVHDNWTITAREHLLDNIRSKPIFISKINEVISFCNTRKLSVPFRRSLDLAGFPVTVGVFADEKEILMGADRFSFELLLIKAFDLDSQQVFAHEISKLKSFVNSVGVLDCKTFPTETEYLTITHELPDLMLLHKDYPSIDDDTFEMVKDLATHQSAYKSTFFEKLTDYGLALTASYSILRIHLLKFIAILTCLDHDKKGGEVKRILLESFRRLVMDHKKAKRDKLTGELAPLPTHIYFLCKIALFKYRWVPAVTLAWFIRFAVKLMAKRFIAGENIAQALDTMKDLSSTGRDATLDQLGELVVSEKEADEYYNSVKELINGLAQAYPNAEKNKSLINIAHVSIKVSALCCDFKPHAFDYTYSLVFSRLKSILELACSKNVFINIDAEHYAYRDLVFKIYRKILLETECLANFDQTGIVVQAYLRDSHLHFNDILELAKTRNVKMPIRLVKGAYWDAETIEADAHNFNAPQFLNKEESDIKFRQLIYMTLESSADLILAVASHNIHDHCWAECLRSELFPNAPHIEHQCLHMTYEALSVGLSKMGWPVRNYVPVGNLLVGMAYLVRRIMENSSQVGILTIMRSHHNLDSYTGPLDAFNSNVQNQTIVYDEMLVGVNSGFYPVSPLRLYIDEHFHEFEQASFSHLLQKDIIGESIYSNIEPCEVLSRIKFYKKEEVTKLIEENSPYINDFQTSLFKRCVSILKAQEKIHLERSSLAKLIMNEAGKSILEALADVDEAVDFINFYLREYVDNFFSNKDLIARGNFGVIAPWNFPLAIPVGMSIAPLICGNKVFLKSSEKSPAISEAFYQILMGAGVPKNVFFHVSGDGQNAGAALVESDKINGIVFTGSKNIGQKIFSSGNSKLIEFNAQMRSKKIISEMGGKNAIIVTNNCELDETVSGIIYSVFAHAGQKCSACSRIIIHESIKEAFIKRFVTAVKDLKIAPASNYASFINNVISKTDKVRILRDVEIAINEAKEFGGQVHVDKSSAEGLHELAVGPVVIELPMNRALSNSSMSQKEMFGPIVHLISYKNLDEAITIFNTTDYALTGGIYCQSQDDIDYLQTKLEAGNIYINRPSTGARVAIEPFGGFKMSGTGPKAGSINYLPSFMTYKNIESTADKEHDFVLGSEYMFYNPRPLKLGPKAKLKVTLAIIKDFVKRFEAINAEVNEPYKASLKDFYSWVINNWTHLKVTATPNYITPGQHNYNLQDLSIKTALFNCYSKSPSLKCLYYFFNALLSGCGILIMCRTNESYSFWYQMIDILRRNGISKDHVDVYLTNVENLHLAISSSAFELQYIEANLQTTNTILEKSVDLDIFKGCVLKKIITEFDGYQCLDFERIFSEFNIIRSFAINTMRHGASLDLNFDQEILNE